MSPDKVAGADPAALSEYRHLMETFALGEILKQVSWWEAPVNIGHYRTGAGDEVDLVLERDDGTVIAFKIKAGSRVHDEDLRGLRSLAGRLGKRLVAAIVLYTGTRSYEHDGVMMIPLDRLWVELAGWVKLSGLDANICSCRVKQRSCTPTWMRSTPPSSSATTPACAGGR